MGTKQTTKLASGWVLDEAKNLYHYYQEEASMAAHRPLCDGSLLLTAVVRRRAQAELPAGLMRIYEDSNSGRERGVAVCMACSNRHAKLKK